VEFVNDLIFLSIPNNKSKLKNVALFGTVGRKNGPGLFEGIAKLYKYETISITGVRRILIIKQRWII